MVNLNVQNSRQSSVKGNEVASTAASFVTYDNAAYVEENDFGLAAHLCIDTLENCFHWLIFREHS